MENATTAYTGVVYYASLLVCISLGSYYKQISDVDVKRKYGTGLGLLLAVLICGKSVFHSALMVWGNIIIIKCCDRRYMTQISMTFTWLHLWYMHSNITNIYVIWIHQTLALKLVGLAFEMSATTTKTDAKGPISKIGLTDIENIVPEPSAVDIISYAYCFIGLHRGPYYRWKIYDDNFSAPFGALGDCKIITEQKLKKAILFGLACWAINSKCSTQLYYDDAFYKSYGADFRYLFSIPHLTFYLLYNEAIMMLCTSVFTETGFGVYPAKCLPLPGLGPSHRLSLLKLAASTPDLALEEEYNFTSIKCFNNNAVIMGPKLRDTMRGWQMPTRYWFWAYAQKGVLKSANRVVRSACSLLAWIIWAGPTLPRVILGFTLWVYVHLEAEYAFLYDTSGAMKVPWDIGFSIMRLLCLFYLTPCFVINNTDVVLRYYNSIFWVFHIILFISMFFSIYLYKTRGVVTTVSE